MVRLTFSATIVFHSSKLFDLNVLVNVEALLTAYEMKKMNQCLQNNARMRQLGIPALARLLSARSTISVSKISPFCFINFVYNNLFCSISSSLLPPRRTLRMFLMCLLSQLGA